MQQKRLFTIGFTKKCAREFFEALCTAGVKRVIDVRLQNTSQLAGFAKSDDLRYFLEAIGGIGYQHRPGLAPAKELLDAFRSKQCTWRAYRRKFLALLAERGVIETMAEELRDADCLLCSEPTPEHCHRRLVAECLAKKMGNLRICHL